MKTSNMVRNQSNSSLGRGVKNSDRKQAGSIDKKKKEVVRTKSEQRRLNQTAYLVKPVINL